MTDDELDDLLREQARAVSPRPDLVASLVAQARPRRRIERWAIGLAAAAVLALAVGPLLQRVAGSVDPSAGLPTPVAEAVALPDGHRLLELPEGGPSMADFPRAGDSVDVLVVVDVDGASESVTLLRGVEVVDPDPVVVAVTPAQAEKVTHALSDGQLFLAVASDGWSEVVVTVAEPATPGDEVDVHVTMSQDGDPKTFLLVQGASVVEVDGPRVRLRVTPDQAEAVALGHHSASLSLVRRP